MSICKNCNGKYIKTGISKKLDDGTCLDCRKTIETQKFHEMRKKGVVKRYKSAKNTYGKAVEFRKLESNKKLQEDMWSKFSEQLEFDIDADVKTLESSEEVNYMMEQRRLSIIRALTGLEQDGPIWSRVEVDEDEDERN